MAPPPGSSSFPPDSMDAAMIDAPAAFPPRLQALGTEDRPFRDLFALAELPPGSMRAGQRR